MRSSWSLGLFFLVFGALAMSRLGGVRPPLTPVGIALVVLLAIAGVALLLQRPFALWAALVAAGATVVTGLLVVLGHPAWGLPLPGGLSAGVGGYLILRTLMVRSSLHKRPRGFLPRDEHGVEQPQDPR